MKTIVSALSVCLVVVCVAGGLVLVNKLRLNHELQQANQNLQDRLQSAWVRTDSLLAEKEESGKQVELLREVAEGLQARIAEQDTGDTVPTLTPYQTPAFLGQKFIGQAWIVPRNLRKDTNTQSYVYEQVVWLDERLLENFVTKANVAEQVVENQTYVNNTYYPEPYYYAGYPIYYQPRSNYFQAKPNPPPATPTPAPPIVNPRSGVVTLRQAGPVTQIRTRPQATKPPASPRRPPPSAGVTRATNP